MNNIKKITITNKNGLSAEILNLGGIIFALYTPNSQGVFKNITLGLDTPLDYLSNPPYFGAIIGRYANRISNGEFKLNHHLYKLPINEGKSCLHGGHIGFDKVFWDILKQSDHSVELFYRAKDGEEGFPGNLNVFVYYELTDQNQLIITYKAKSDQNTIINLTNHSYFNLNDDNENIKNHRLKIYADSILEVDSYLRPTGKILNIKNTPFDFHEPQFISTALGQLPFGIDHNYILNKESPGLSLAAELSEERSGRSIKVYTTEPGLQVYTGNNLDVSIYAKNMGICLETQHFPDSPNHPDFPSTTLMANQEFISQTIYQFMF
ncbi:MAG: aldose epimerase family protein [Bacteriovoracaceae bacterium]